MSRAGIAILIGSPVAGAIALLWLAPPWRSALLTVLAALVALLIFLTTRHLQITQSRQLRRWTHLGPPGHRKVRRLAQDYYLFVLGSGGHTKEMLMMMDDGSCDFAGLHRRYLISSGDKMSENHLEDYEAELRALCEKKGTAPGTYDKRTVTRARRVHQPLWSTPFSALLSVVDIFPILLSPPKHLTARRVRFPSQIFSNGPATGFFVALAVHVLKMFYLVPLDRMQFIYIESWARISTLSLTGKLLFYTGLADVLLVQHEEVAAAYGMQNAGPMVFNSRRIDG
ncbi:hypothetical protein S40285_01754 [Stachybotrys chlorohalonatus IBT 40285]|uniref:UDP-N-acetylglucosamine transferase subunit ALG14 n=1 Tax=Stachybotrys chlorohalonatus (strain IBT 40285) TaxID=1283841 RepID=A0A084R275_STAC4|nr:hypothetical protein S40285_01754 [Stachybotrys chlorohalonata IBT 40285]